MIQTTIKRSKTRPLAFPKPGLLQGPGFVQALKDASRPRRRSSDGTWSLPLTVSLPAAVAVSAALWVGFFLVVRALV